MSERTVGGANEGNYIRIGPGWVPSRAEFHKTIAASSEAAMHTYHPYSGDGSVCLPKHTWCVYQRTAGASTAESGCPCARLERLGLPTRDSNPRNPLLGAVLFPLDESASVGIL